MELNCLILNCSPYGPQDENGIGKNTAIQYIPLNTEECKNTDKSFGYYVSYNVLFDKSENSLFSFIKKNNLILTPVKITINGSKKHCKIVGIDKLK